jgi:hypothetical protein
MPTTAVAQGPGRGNRVMRSSSAWKDRPQAMQPSPPVCAMHVASRSRWTSARARVLAEGLRPAGRAVSITNALRTLCLPRLSALATSATGSLGVWALGFVAARCWTTVGVPAVWAEWRGLPAILTLFSRLV